jgi:hypothetical protein
MKQYVIPERRQIDKTEEHFYAGLLASYRDSL